LAGGESRRMGHDKALITLGDKPAYLYMADLLLQFCDEVYVSCREDQQLTFGENTKVVGLFDQPAHAGRGPMSGMLSYLNHCSDNQSQFSDNQSIAPTNGLLLLGCDYRKMTEETLGWWQSDKPKVASAATKTTSRDSSNHLWPTTPQKSCSKSLNLRKRIHRSDNS